MTTDFLGRPLAVNDTVAYPTRSGSYMAMVHATVKEVHENHIVVQPISEGGRRREQKKLVDTRTGKEIYNTTPHEVRPSGYTHKRNGEYITFKEMYPDGRARSDWNDYQYAGAIYKDYVREITVPGKPVSVSALNRVVRL